MDHQKRCSRLINDERFFKEEKMLFTKIWGIDPSTRSSISSRTEHEILDGEKYIDPLANGISLDLVSESTADVDSRMNFDENSLFKLNSMQVPSTLAEVATGNENQLTVNQYQLDLLKGLHEKHKSNDYTMCMYVDEGIELITIPNSNFNATKGALPIKLKYFETPNYKNKSFQENYDQRITFQIGDFLIESEKPYDVKTFRNQIFPKHESDIKKIGEKNKIDQNKIFSAKVVLRLLKRQGPNDCYKPVDKSEITEIIRIKDLANDRILEYEILNIKKFTEQNLHWGFGDNELTNIKIGEKDMITWKPIIAIEKNKKNEICLKHIVDENIHALCTEQFYSRYIGDISRNPNFEYYKLFKTYNPYLMLTMDNMNKYYRQFPHNNRKNRISTHYFHGKEDKDLEVMMHLGKKKLEPSLPKLRMRRMLSAYNRTTGEICVQFLPIIQDTIQVAREAWKESIAPTDYQTWFFYVAKTAEVFLSTRSPSIKGTTRKIFTLELIDPSKGMTYREKGRWTIENMPLIHLKIEYTRSSDKENADLLGIKCQFYYNVERLNFDLYGPCEALYNLERFFSEFIMLHESVYNLRIRDHTQKRTHLVTNSRGKQLSFFNGEWFSSRENGSKAENGYFGRNYRPGIVKTINMNDENDIYLNVRTKETRSFLKNEHKGRWEIIKKHLDDNLTRDQKAELMENNGDYPHSSHRYRLVFLPDLRESEIFWIPPKTGGTQGKPLGERLEEFGLGILSSSQHEAIKNFHIEITRMFGPTSYDGLPDSIHSISKEPSYFGLDLNSETVGPKALGGSNFEKATFTCLMMSGTEFDICKYENFVIEPCNELKELFSLHNSVDKVKRIGKTENYADKTRPKMKRHPLFDSKNGKFLGSAVQGSFWQYPLFKTSRKNMTLHELFDYEKSLLGAEPGMPPKRNQEIFIKMDLEGKQFLNESEISMFKNSSLVIGGKVKASSIRVEAPDFLENSYNYMENFYQEHAKITINPINAVKSEYREERKRLRQYEISETSNAQKIKKRKCAAIEMHFFLSNGARPIQVTNGDLKDLEKQGIKYAPIRNVDVSIFTPKFDKRLLLEIGRADFLEKGVKKLSEKTLYFDEINMLVSLHNVYLTERRLTSAFGNEREIKVPNIVSERINENGEFYRRLYNMWLTVDNGNKALKSRFDKISKHKDHFSTSLLGEEPFEMKMHVEEIILPLSVKGLENDETIHVISDLDFSTSEKTNVNGKSNKKIMCTINLKSIDNFEEKSKNHFVQNFSSLLSSDPHVSNLKSYPIKITRIVDVKSYKFYFVNSKFQPITIEQKPNENFKGKFIPDSVSIKVKFYITNKLTPMI